MNAERADPQVDQKVSVTKRRFTTSHQAGNGDNGRKVRFQGVRNTAGDKVIALIVNNRNGGDRGRVRQSGW